MFPPLKFWIFFLSIGIMFFWIRLSLTVLTFEYDISSGTVIDVLHVAFYGSCCCIRYWHCTLCSNFLVFLKISTNFLRFCLKENQIWWSANWSFNYLISHLNYYLICTPWKSTHPQLTRAILIAKYLTNSVFWCYSFPCLLFLKRPKFHHRV